jgi:transcriptional regulator with XRE-family HTH domain
MKIKQQRQALGLTQRALAEKLGVSVTTVSAWETGRRNPSQMSKKFMSSLGTRPATATAEEVGDIDPYFEDEEGNRAALIDLDGRTVSYLLKLGHKVHTGK